MMDIWWVLIIGVGLGIAVSALAVYCDKLYAERRIKRLRG